MWCGVLCSQVASNDINEKTLESRATWPWSVEGPFKRVQAHAGTMPVHAYWDAPALPDLGFQTNLDHIDCNLILSVETRC